MPRAALTNPQRKFLMLIADADKPVGILKLQLETSNWSPARIERTMDTLVDHELVKVNHLAGPDPVYTIAPLGQMLANNIVAAIAALPPRT